MRSSWKSRIGFGFTLLLVIAAVMTALNWSKVNARIAARQLTSTDSEEERLAAAGKLLALGEPGYPHLAEPFVAGNEPVADAVLKAYREHLKSIPPTDPRHAQCLQPLIEGFSSFAPLGKESLTPMASEIAAASHPEAMPRARDMVRAGLGSSNPERKIAAIRLAMRPDFALVTEVVPLLRDESPEVRRCALLTVGPIPENGNSPIAEEDLFAFLHDKDPEMRELCGQVLRTRGLDDRQIQYARQLTDSDASERMKLLLDIRWAGEELKNPGQWLERLSRDSDPSVRLGAARVGSECKLLYAGWLDRLADRDPDANVRQWSNYYKKQLDEIRPASFRGNGP